MTKDFGTGWKARAIRDPNLTDRQWTVLNLGPTSLSEVWILLAMKLKYQIRGIDGRE
jgi:hypothetical protein